MPRRVRIIVFILLGVSVIACQNPSGGGSGNTGSLNIILGNNINAKDLVSSTNLNTAKFRLSGVGPNNAAFDNECLNGPVFINNLASGVWKVVANAFDDNSEVIGSGYCETEINTNQLTAVYISVDPVSGFGDLDLGISWTDGDIQIPSITASLIPTLGANQPLLFSISGAAASFAGSHVRSGYYILLFTLLDNGLPAASEIDLIRIIAGRINFGSFHCGDIKKPGGSIRVNLTANLQNPLNPVITGNQPVQSEGTVQSLQASVANYSGNIIYVWFVNGVSRVTGSAFPFGAGISSGYYRIDVTAYTADGTRAGSATTQVQVIK